YQFPSQRLFNVFCSAYRLDPVDARMGKVRLEKSEFSKGENLIFILNPQSGIPIYRQLAEQIRRMVAGGQLQAGDELPSVRELAVAHAVNPMTISKAYSLLEVEGVLVRQRGKPMQVAEQST